MERTGVELDLIENAGSSFRVNLSEQNRNASRSETRKSTSKPESLTVDNVRPSRSLNPSPSLHSYRKPKLHQAGVKCHSQDHPVGFIEKRGDSLKASTIQPAIKITSFEKNRDSEQRATLAVEEDDYCGEGDSLFPKDTNQSSPIQKSTECIKKSLS